MRIAETGSNREGARVRAAPTCIAEANAARVIEAKGDNACRRGFTIVEMGAHFGLNGGLIAPGQIVMSMCVLPNALPARAHATCAAL